MTTAGLARRDTVRGAGTEGETGKLKNGLSSKRCGMHRVFLGRRKCTCISPLIEVDVNEFRERERERITVYCTHFSLVYICVAG